MVSPLPATPTLAGAICYLVVEIDNVVKACREIWQSVTVGQPLELTPARVKHFNSLVLGGLDLDDGVVPGECRQHKVGVANYLAAPPQDCEFWGSSGRTRPGFVPGHGRQPGPVGELSLGLEGRLAHDDVRDASSLSRAGSPVVAGASSWPYRQPGPGGSSSFDPCRSAFLAAPYRSTTRRPGASPPTRQKPALPACGGRQPAWIAPSGRRPS